MAKQGPSTANQWCPPSRATQPLGAPGRCPALFLQAVQVHGRWAPWVWPCPTSPHPLPLQGACGEEGDAVQQGEFCTQRLSVWRI